jgi:uncharacterized membrane protein YdbT with pleckstrin-like domain
MSVADHLQPEEEVLFQARVSRVPLIPWAVLLALFAIGAGFAWQALGQPIAAIVLGIVALVVAAVIGWKLFVLNSYDYVLTNHRVIRQTGLLTRHSVDSNLEKVNNVEHTQTLWGRILGYGDVVVDTASETGMTVFSQISRPLDFKRAIVQAAETYRSGQGRFPAGAAGFAAPARPSGEERMRQLKALLDQGMISPQEFEAKRQQVLSEM